MLKAPLRSVLALNKPIVGVLLFTWAVWQVLKYTEYELFSVLLALAAYMLDFKGSLPIFKKGLDVSVVQHLHHPLKLLRMLCYIYSMLPRKLYDQVIEPVMYVVLVLQLVTCLWINFSSVYPRTLQEMDWFLLKRPKFANYRKRKYCMLILVFFIRMSCEFVLRPSKPEEGSDVSSVKTVVNIAQNAWNAISLETCATMVSDLFVMPASNVPEPSSFKFEYLKKLSTGQGLQIVSILCAFFTQWNCVDAFF